MKKLLALMITLIFLITQAQNLQTVRTYYDPYTKTTINEVYTVIAGTPTKQGIYKAYDQKGILIKESNYINGKVEGTYKEYYSSTYDLDSRGKLGLVENYKNGLRHGTSEEYEYPYGKRWTKETETWETGELVKRITYWPNGKIQTEQGLTYGIKYYEDGMVQQKDKSTKSDTLISRNYYRNNGEISDSIFLNADGYYIWIALDSAGRLASVSQCGAAQKGDYDPVKDGEFVEYFSDGAISVKGTKQEGVWNGTITNYFPNGKPNIVAHYAQGRECGTWQVYDAAGELVRTKNFPEQRDLHGHTIKCPQ